MFFSTVALLLCLPPLSALGADAAKYRPAAAATAQTCIDEARRLQAQHKPAEVIKLLNYCIADNRDVVAFYWYRAQAHMTLKHYREAILDCTAQTKIAGDLIKPFEMRADCYVALNEKRKAARDWQHIVEMQPNNINAHQKLAQYYKEQGDSRGWQKESALAKNPKVLSFSGRQGFDPASLTKNEKPAWHLYEEATETLARGKPGLTLDKCKTLLTFSEKELKIECFPKSNIYELQAQAFQKMDIHDQAITAVNAALKLTPTNRHLYFIRAQSNCELGRYQECLDDCDKAAKGDAILSSAVASLRAKAEGRLKRRN